MPMVQGDPHDDPHAPKQRIANTRKLLIWAALIMSVLLMGSSLVTATLVPPLDMKHVEKEDIPTLTAAEIAKLDPAIYQKAIRLEKDYRGPAVERT